MLMERENVFSTSDVDLATFLMMEDIKFLSTSFDLENRDIIVLNFFDDKGKCRDLERVYLNSPFKKFRDLNKYVLKKVHSKLRERR